MGARRFTVIVMAVHWYLRYGMSFRDVEELRAVSTLQSYCRRALINRSPRDTC
jgi:transposase-like protein